MLTLITGAPGSGKTLYTIAKLLRPLLGKTVTKHNDDGSTTELPRTIYTNIRGLLVDHELIDEERLNTWHEWAPPGAIICFDEVQKPWPPRPNGSKVPDYIQQLETHRHMGVDFILMTQHPLLIDRNVVNLVGRHLHMRRVANMALAVVYEWDHCSRSLLFRNSITKSPWRYDKTVYKLYKSAEVHTKQPRKVPGLVWFILAGLVGFAYLMPTFFDRLGDRVQGKAPGVEAKSASPGKPIPRAELGHEPTPAVATPPDALAAAGERKGVSGCIAQGTRCQCFGTDGNPVDPMPQLCTSMAQPARSEVDLLPDSPRVVAASADDLDMRRFMLSQRGPVRAE
jgi:zona occludens toxin